MEKEFVPFTESLELKQLGFDEPCFVYWVFNNVEITFSTTDNRSGWSMIGFTNSQMSKKAGLCTAPTYSQVFRWFRKKHQIVCVIDFYNDGDIWEDTMYTVTISEFEHFNSHDSFVQFEYKTYEEAELACLRKLISIIKNK